MFKSLFLTIVCLLTPIAVGYGAEAEKAQETAPAAAAQAAPEAAAQHYDAGVKAINNGDFDRAIEELKTAIAQNDKKAAYHFQLGVAYASKEGMLEEAKVAYLQAIDVAPEPKPHTPEVPQAYYNLASVHALQGKIGEALDVLEKAVDVGFNDDALMKTDADLERIRGEFRFQVILGKLTLRKQAAEAEAKSEPAPGAENDAAK